MRRSTAAAVGTLTGAALILAVRLSASTAPLAAPPAFDASQVGAAVDSRPTDTAASRGKQRDKAEDDDEPTAAPSRRQQPSAEEERRQEEPEEEEEEPESAASDLRDGKFSGTRARNPYGSVQVAITVADGRVTAAAASYPTAGLSASINANAVPKLKQATVQAQSAELDAVSGATFTSESYVQSLQAALDAARG